VKPIILLLEPFELSKLVRSHPTILHVLAVEGLFRYLHLAAPMAILMGDAFGRNPGQPYETPDIDVDEGYRFDIVVGGRNAIFFE